MNVPGRTDCNWRWRFSETRLCDAVFERLKDLTRASNRSNNLADAPLPAKSNANEIEVTI
jgi:4-alpha-glucanotransferase